MGPKVRRDVRKRQRIIRAGLKLRASRCTRASGCFAMKLRWLRLQYRDTLIDARLSLGVNVELCARIKQIFTIKSYYLS